MLIAQENVMKLIIIGQENVMKVVIIAQENVMERLKNKWYW